MLCSAESLLCVVCLCRAWLMVTCSTSSAIHVRDTTARAMCCNKRNQRHTRTPTASATLPRLPNTHHTPPRDSTLRLHRRSQRPPPLCIRARATCHVLVVHGDNKPYLCDVTRTDPLANSSLVAAAERSGQPATGVAGAGSKRIACPPMAEVMGVVHASFAVEMIWGAEPERATADPRDALLHQ